MSGGTSLERGYPRAPRSPDNEPVNGSAVSGVRSLLRRLREEGGFNLVELVTTMAIMLFVVTALVQLSTSGTKAENDLNKRFQAQEEARLGLDMFRREVHNACAATISGGGTQVTLKSNDTNVRGSFPCTVVGSNWCTSGSGARFGRRLPDDRRDLLAARGVGGSAAEGPDRHDGEPRAVGPAPPLPAPRCDCAA
jgi:type II secretory pathway pseudopilin PulG